MRANRFAIVGGRTARKTMTASSGVTAAAAMSKYYFGSNQRDNFVCGHVAQANADGFGVAPKDLLMTVTEAASASDKRSTGTYGVLSPTLSFDAGWTFDTSTPTAETRAFNSAANQSVTFSCYNVPSLTFTIQKDYGWGKADVFVNNVNVGMLDSSDAVGGGFLATTTIPVSVSGDSPITVRVTSRSTAPIVLVKVKFDTDAASPGATWNIIPNNMDHKEQITATASQSTKGGSSAVSVAEVGIAAATTTAGKLKSAVIGEQVTAKDSHNSYFVKACYELAQATDYVVRNKRVTARTITAAANATTAQTGKRSHLMSVSEAANAGFNTAKTTWRWIEELLSVKDTVNCVAEMKVSHTAGVTATTTSNRGKRFSATKSEATTATHSDASLIITALLEVAHATVNNGVVYRSGDIKVVEMSFAADSLETAAALKVALKEAAKASATNPARMDSFASAVAAAIATESVGIQIAGPSQIVTAANPFLADLPAVFRVVSVRVTNGERKESDPSPRVWGRIEKASRGNSPGDLFSAPSNRLYPGSDFATNIMPYDI